MRVINCALGFLAWMNVSRSGTGGEGGAAMNKLVSHRSRSAWRVGPTLLWVSLVALSAQSGCFSTTQVSGQDVLEELKGFRGQGASSRPARRIGGEISVRLAVGSSLGCILRPTKSGEKAHELGAFECSSFNLTSGREDQQLRAMGKKLNSKLALQLTGVDKLLAFVLKEHLSGLFDRVSVMVGGSPAAQPAGMNQGGKGALVSPAFVYYSGVWKFSKHRTFVTLTATPQGGGAPITATGHAEWNVSPFHLFWAIPLALAFPVGTIITNFVLLHMDNVARLRSIGLAFDRAAKDLAAKMASQWTGAGPVAWVVRASVGLKFVAKTH